MLQLMLPVHRRLKFVSSGNPGLYAGAVIPDTRSAMDHLCASRQYILHVAIRLRPIGARAA